jgi:hypothetical protein
MTEHVHSEHVLFFTRVIAYLKKFQVIIVKVPQLYTFTKKVDIFKKSVIIYEV